MVPFESLNQVICRYVSFSCLILSIFSYIHFYCLSYLSSGKNACNLLARQSWNEFS